MTIVSLNSLVMIDKRKCMSFRDSNNTKSGSVCLRDSMKGIVDLTEYLENDDKSAEIALIIFSPGHMIVSISARLLLIF